MAALPGLSLNCAACWGWRDEGRIQSPVAAHMVRDAFQVAATVKGRQMKTPAPIQAEASAPNSLNFSKPRRFTPRQQRALDALWTGPKMREALDRMTGCSNGPQLVRDLKDKGIEINCTLIESTDRDGRPCKPGRYELTDKGRKALHNLGWPSGERAQ